jgi:hypothetical protein
VGAVGALFFYQKAYDETNLDVQAQRESTKLAARKLPLVPGYVSRDAAPILAGFLKQPDVLVLVHGPKGTGKSTLIRQTLAERDCVVIEVPVRASTDLDQALAKALGANEAMLKTPESFYEAVLKSLKDKGKKAVVWYNINISPTDKVPEHFSTTIIKHGKMLAADHQLCECVFDFSSTQIIGRATDEPRLRKLYVDMFSDAERAAYLKAKFANRPELVQLVEQCDVREASTLAMLTVSDRATSDLESMRSDAEVRCDIFMKNCPTQDCKQLLLKLVKDGSVNVSGAGDLGEWKIDHFVTVDLSKQQYKFYNSFARAIARERVAARKFLALVILANGKSITL